MPFDFSRCFEIRDDVCSVLCPLSALICHGVLAQAAVYFSSMYA